MPKVAIVAALQREVSGLTADSLRVEREHEGREFVFYESDERIVVCGGIGFESARRAAEAVIAIYHPALMLSVGFAGALQTNLQVGDIFTPALVVDARDGSRFEIDGGKGTLLSFMEVAGVRQKTKLAQAYGAQAIEMEAAAVATSARAHEIRFVAVKVISDELNFEMPGISRFVDSQGQFRTAGFAFFAAMRPWLWIRIAALARNSRKAAKALSDHLDCSCCEASHALCAAAENIAPPQAVTRRKPQPVTANDFRTEGHE
jgi:adenosylhomocysteine nucleosidase